MLAAVAAAHVLAPASAFDAPIADAELALSSSPMLALALAAPTAPHARLDRIGAADQMDVWWAEQGMMMIAESVRPAPTAPAWFDPTMLRQGALTIRLNTSVSAVTRP